ncbi:mediator of RNA polymerase II transcription subunit 25-like [Rutidosis leptorrhynchoides]|uniref:mediator of RNA polymerase II transcription subunit 25-like n=1 Tax=Rutidosis leptorrhynchoides TaxID=125765 RepID=UPI003A993B70
MADDQKKQLVLVVEGTAALGLHWRTILSDYLEKFIRSFCGDEATVTRPYVELALVIFNTHGPYSPCLVQRSSWTRHLDFFFEWLSDIHFSGGGFCDAAIAEGLSESLMVCIILSSPNGSQTQQNEESLQKHCILVAASNPYPLPTLVYRPPNKSEAQFGSHLSEAETVAKSFPQSFVSLSVICPRQLPKLKAIYEAGKRNPSTADPTIDIVKNPHHLVLISENFMEDCVDLKALLITKSPSNQTPTINDVTSDSPVNEQPPTSVSPVKDSPMNQQSVSVEKSLISVKVEPGTVSSPSSISQKMISSNDNSQDIKPVVSGIQQPVCPTAPANVDILNNLSHKRLNSSTGVTPMTSQTSNMTSSVPVSQTGSTTLSAAGTAQGPQSTGTIMATHTVSREVQQTSSAVRSGPSKYAKTWEAYRSLTTSEKLTEDWPSKLQIDRLISQEHMNNKPCHPKGEILVFRALNQHGFLQQLQEKKLCTVIRLPSQMLLLAVTDKSCRLLGMLFPGDKVIINPKVSRPQQLAPTSSSSSQQQEQQKVKLETEEKFCDASQIESVDSLTYIWVNEVGDLSSVGRVMDDVISPDLVHALNKAAWLGDNFSFKNEVVSDVDVLNEEVFGGCPVAFGGKILAGKQMMAFCSEKFFYITTPPITTLDDFNNMADNYHYDPVETLPVKFYLSCVSKMVLKTCLTDEYQYS